jgi:hypothetical protein
VDSDIRKIPNLRPKSDRELFGLSHPLNFSMRRASGDKGSTETQTKAIIKDDYSDVDEMRTSIPKPFFQDRDHAAVITELKLDVLSRQQRLDLLKVESARIRREMIRPSELAVIQAQVRATTSETSLTTISSLMTAYAEEMRAISALNAICIDTEKRLVNERKLREEIIRETEDISRANGGIDFDPPENRPKAPSNSVSADDITFQEGKLASLRSELLHCKTTSSRTPSSVLSVVINGLERQSSLNSLGVSELRAEIDQLNQRAEESDRLMQTLSAEVQRLRGSMKPGVSRPLQEKDTSRFDAELQGLSERIFDLRSRVDHSAADVLKLSREVAELHPLAVPLPAPAAPIEWTESESSEAEEEVINDDQELIDQKRVLRMEVSVLSRQYAMQKQAVKSREKVLKLHLRTLSTELSSALALAKWTDLARSSGDSIDDDF